MVVWIAIVGAAATWVMVGIAWFTQVVHYPMLRLSAGDGSGDAAVEHARRTGWIVGPVMLVEAASAIALLVVRPDGVTAWSVWLAAALLAGVWASTALVQMPHHARLQRGFDPATHRALVRWSTPRTLLWSVRGVVMAGIVAAAT